MTVHWQGFAVGFLGLTMLDVLLSSPNATNGLGGLANGAGNLAQKILSPTVPAFATTAAPSSISSPQPTPSGTGQPPAAGQPPAIFLPQPAGQPPINFNTPLAPGISAT